MRGDPRDIFFAMAQQAAVGAVLLAEPFRHIEFWNIVDLVRPGLKEDAVHNTRHVATDASACLRSGWMMSVGHTQSRVIRVALQAHLVWPLQVLERYGVSGRVWRVGVVAIAAGNLAASVAGRPHQGFHNECSLSESAIFVKSPARKLDEGPTRIPGHE
jgi:hypothetical protein